MAITTGGNMKARHVIHAVGAVWPNGDEDEPKLLAGAYRRSLEVAVQNGLRSISFRPSRPARSVIQYGRRLQWLSRLSSISGDARLERGADGFVYARG